jgi:hypothetical protein
MAKLDVFVAPSPNPRLIRALNFVNRWLMLGGIPVLRSMPVLGRIPGIRGFADIQEWDYPADDQARLKSLCGPGQAVFIVPNHPEFFTDWMIDKQVLSRAAPLAACWATHGVVNGLGNLAQKFWLANNLIAQIPGDGGAARAHSVGWAVQGHGVLLHPEGSVGWHSNYIAPLFAGAAEMAMEALEAGRAQNPLFQSFVAPIVWKLSFLGDVSAGLSRECAYVEKRLRIATPSGASPAQRVFLIYSALLTRDEMALGLTGGESAPFRDRQKLVVAEVTAKMAAILGLDAGAGADWQRLARRRLRELDRKSAGAGELKHLSEMLFRTSRIGEFAFQKPDISQEEVAEHIKRIRSDSCAGTFRDSFNAFVPQPAGPRRAILRVAEPVALHEWRGTAGEAMATVRQRMQGKLDDINTGLSPRLEKNPFWAGA